MKITISIREDLLARAKATADLRGTSLDDLIAECIAIGTANQGSDVSQTGHRRPVPVVIAPAGRTLNVLSNSEIETILLREDLERLGLDGV